ncbi:MAG: hypothetical protein SFV81_00500 [Pirellulaceae bacterium]|nr:hypothetical protein [Pirellulaceae bacterium]
MSSRRSIIGLSLVLGALPAAVCLETAQADPPSLLSMFKRKPTSSNGFQLSADQGPWMILAASLSGDDAQAKAEALARELQQNLKVECYVLDKTFDRSSMLKTDRHQTVDIVSGNIESRRVRMANQSSERVCAVLVGNFASLSDPAIKELLQTIRTAQPAALAGKDAADTKDPSKTESSNWLVSSARRVIWARTDRESNKTKGPMGAAFVTRNPLLPDEFFQAPKVDDFVVELNKSVEHSLLKCPKRFTVRVASFQGSAVTGFASSGSDSAEKEPSDNLDVAADNANKLTMALRAKGVEAYQFHDHYASYVTIGSFDELGPQTPSGEIQFSPAIQQILDEYCGYTTVDAKLRSSQAPTKVQTVKSLDKIPFDIEGKPMAVPRAGTSKLYGGSLLGKKAIQ